MTSISHRGCVIDPVRKIEFERHAFEAAPEQRAHMQATLDMGENVLESDGFATGYRRRIENCNCSDLNMIFL
jgi:hypothetical protein